MKILLIEDDPHLVELLSFALLRAGYYPVPAYTSARALELLEIEEPALVLLDIALGEESGLELLVSIREQSDVPVIMISTVLSEEQRIQAFELGADDYLVKPFGLRELLALIRARLRRLSGAHDGDNGWGASQLLLRV